jgi:hypothetical protein
MDGLRHRRAYDRSSTVGYFGEESIDFGDDGRQIFNEFSLEFDED